MHRPSDGRERGLKPSSRSLADTGTDEPVTPELVLVDPDLARRAREPLSQGEPPLGSATSAKAARSEEALPHYIQPTAATRRAREHGRASTQRRLAVPILVVAIVGAVAGIAIAHAKSLKPFFSRSPPSSVAPADGGTSPARASPNRTEGREMAASQNPILPRRSEPRLRAEAPSGHCLGAASRSGGSGRPPPPQRRLGARSAGSRSAVRTPISSGSTAAGRRCSLRDRALSFPRIRRSMAANMASCRDAIAGRFGRITLNARSERTDRRSSSRNS